MFRPFETFYRLSGFYFLIWVVRFAFSSAVYHSTTLVAFVFPLVAILFILREVFRAKECSVGAKKSWIIGLSISLAVVPFLSWKAWRFYLDQDDAPRGIIPEVNLIFCAFLTLVIVGITIAIDRPTNSRIPIKKKPPDSGGF